MKYTRFEELPVWQAAISLAVEIYKFTGNEGFKGQGGLRDQIERATVSISNNVAEGFERGTTNELLSFLYIARGSAGEVRSMLCLIERLPAFNNFKFEIFCRKHLPAVTGVGRCAAKLRDQGPALPNREGPSHFASET